MVVMHSIHSLCLGRYWNSLPFFCPCSIVSYGLKSWEDTPIDVIEDGGCATMPTVEGLYSVRTPDSITAIIVGDDTYIATGTLAQSFLTLFLRLI